MTITIPLYRHVPGGHKHIHGSLQQCRPTPVLLASYSSWLDPVEFVKVAEEAGYKDMNQFKFVSNYLTNGAKIGCEGEGRWPTRGRNDPSVSTHGWEIADEIQTGVNMGICVGPLKIDELPFEDFSVSPLT